MTSDSTQFGELPGIGGSPSGPITRSFPDGTLRVLRTGGKAENVDDWVVLSQRPDATKARTYTGTGLPPGYVQGSDGIIYKQFGDGLMPVTNPMADPLLNPPRQAAQGPVARFGFDVVGGRVYRTNDLTGTFEDTGIVAPGFTKVDVDRNGDLVGIDQSGQMQTIQRGFDYAKIDPRETAAEQSRQFDTSQAGMDRRAQLQESGAYDRTVLGEGEANRRAALNAQTQGFNTVANLTPSLGRLALDNASFVRDTYSKPSDFLYASQLTRGVAPVNPMRTQADSINQLSSSIQGYNTALQGFNTTPVAGFGTSPAPQQRVAPVIAPQAVVAASPQVYAPQQRNATGGFDPNAMAPANPTREQANASLKAAGAPSWLPGFADGTGMTTEPVFKVGEEQDGSMNDTSEVIANPTNAPIGVISNAELTGNPADDMEAEEHQKKAKAIGKVMQFVDKPETLHALVDEMFEHKGKMKKMPGFAGGTGFGFGDTYDPRQSGMSGQAFLENKNLYDKQNSGFTSYSPLSGMWYDPSNPDPLTKSRMSAAGSTGGFSFPGIPQIPGVASTTQEQIKADELAARPPAISSILNGEAPKPLNLGFSLPTPGLLNTLTDREKEAFGTTLAVQYNLAPSDVEAAIRQRFGGTGARSARF